MNPKCLFIILDGIGDRCQKILGNRTPLQRAHTPGLDRLARLGSSGLYHPGLCGQCFPEETAHMAIVGYDMHDFPGRGPLEALGAGISFGKNDVLAMCHLACADVSDGIPSVKESRPDITPEEADELYNAIANYEKKGMCVSARKVSGIDGVVIISGNVSPCITDSDPVTEERPVMKIQALNEAGSEAAAATGTAELMNGYLRWAYYVLQGSAVNAARKKRGLRPVNIMVTQRAGRQKQVMQMREKYGLRALSISSSTLYKGISAYTGMDHILSADNSPEEDMIKKLELAEHKLNEYDFIHVHSGEADRASLRKDPASKVRVIESIDRGIRKALPGIMKRDNLFVAVMGGHTSPSTGSMMQSGEPVPVVFYGRGTRRDAVRRFDEISASRGALGLLRGKEVMLCILNILDRAITIGLRDCPADLPYWQGKQCPLKLEQE